MLINKAMISKEILVQNETGIHARPASLIVKRASIFKSRITLTHNNTIYDAKRIINVMKMAADKGDTVIVSAEGIDEEAAVEDIVSLILKDLD